MALFNPFHGININSFFFSYDSSSIKYTIIKFLDLSIFSDEKYSDEYAIYQLPI